MVRVTNFPTEINNMSSMVYRLIFQEDKSNTGWVPIHMSLVLSIWPFDGICCILLWLPEGFICFFLEWKATPDSCNSLLFSYFWYTQACKHQSLAYKVRSVQPSIFKKIKSHVSSNMRDVFLVAAYLNLTMRIVSMLFSSNIRIDSVCGLSGITCTLPLITLHLSWQVGVFFWCDLRQTPAIVVIQQEGQYHSP